MTLSVHNRSLCVVFVLISLGGRVSALAEEPQSSTGAEVTEQVDELFANWNRPDTPGCAVGIVRHGELIYCNGIGSANLEYQVPNTPHTVFETASFSKSLTCVCLALLMDEGKIAPDDDLRKFVPEMHPFDPPIRIQDMVRCRSGLWDQVSLPILVGWENAPQQVPHSEADFFTLLSGQRTLPFQPGTAFRYSSSDYFLLGVIIKRVSGQSLAEFAGKRVFAPLGMTRTFFGDDPTRIVDEPAVGHHKPRGDAWHLWRPTAYWVGGGGLTTCVDDLVRWDANFTHNRLPRGKYLDGFLEDGALLGNLSCLDLDAYRNEVDPDRARESRPGQYRGLRRRQFTGGAWGVSTAMTQFPDEKLTIICLSNCDDIAAWTMNRRIADILLADRLQPKAPLAAATPSNDQPTVEVSEEDLRDKVGAYRMKGTGQTWRITMKDGTLEITDHLLRTYRLRPLSAACFDPEGPFYSSTQLVFSRQDPEAPMTLVSRWSEPDDQDRLEFDAVELVDPTPDQLAQYAGEYVSEELAATYHLAVRDEQLWLRVNSRRWEQLDATVRDEFIPHLRDPVDGRIITFLRDDNGAVDALSIDYYRVKGVRFARR